MCDLIMKATCNDKNYNCSNSTPNNCVTRHFFPLFAASVLLLRAFHINLWCQPIPVQIIQEKMEALLSSPGNQYDFAIVVQISSLTFLLGYWVVAVALTRILETRSMAFREMDIRHRRNVVTYVMEIAASTYTFFVLTAFLPRLLTVTRIKEPLGDTDM